MDCRIWSHSLENRARIHCAGLLNSPDGVLDRLAQQAAIEALRHCQAIIFCVDAAKADFSEDLSIRALIESQDLLGVATKCDLRETKATPGKMAKLQESFGTEFLPTSAKTGRGLDELQHRIAERISPPPAAGQGSLLDDGQDTIALTARHRQAVCEAIESVSQAAGEMEQERQEVAAAMIRAACQALSDIESQPVDEQILDRIFARFCVGK